MKNLTFNSFGLLFSAMTLLLAGCQHPCHDARQTAQYSWRTSGLIQTDPVTRDFGVAIDVIKHNLANVNTPGYKRVQVQFQEAPLGTRHNAGSDSMGLGHGPAVELNGTMRDFSDGDLWETRRPLDLGIQGEGLFAVQLPDGRIAYTRAGAFHIAPSRQLITSGGYPLQAGIPPVPDEGGLRITITRNGQLEYFSPKGGTSHQIVLYRFANPEHLEAIGEDLYLETVPSGQPVRGYPGENGMGLLIQGYLECSNVVPGQELALLEQIQRALEAYGRAVGVEQSLKGNR
jgi:flagellar basal-body rod protein FlgG